MNKRRLIALPFAALALLLGACFLATVSGGAAGFAAAAESGASSAAGISYPTKPINLVVGFNVGGGPDKAARAFAAVAPKFLGEQVVVGQKVGSGGAMAMSYVKQRSADGYTLMLLSTPSEVLLDPKNEYNVDPINDFVLNGRLHVNRGVLAVPNDAPYKTFEELLAYDRENPNTVSIATSGVGSSADTSIGNVNSQLGATFVRIPFSSSNDSLLAVLGGHVDVYCGSGTTALPQIGEGHLVPLVSTYAANRDARYPGIKTLGDYGVRDIADMYGIAVHKDTPREIVDVINRVVENVVNDAEFMEQMDRMGMSIDYLAPDEYTSLYKNLFEFHAEIVNAR